MLCRRSRVVVFRISGSERAIRLLWCAKRHGNRLCNAAIAMAACAASRTSIYRAHGRWCRPGMGAAGIFVFSQPCWSEAQGDGPHCKMASRTSRYGAPALTGFAVERTGSLVPDGNHYRQGDGRRDGWVSCRPVEQVNWAVNGEFMRRIAVLDTYHESVSVSFGRPSPRKSRREFWSSSTQTGISATIPIRSLKSRSHVHDRMAYAWPFFTSSSSLQTSSVGAAMTSIPRRFALC